MSTTLSPAPVDAPERTVPPSVKHFVCTCQVPLGNKGHAYCGQRLAGRPRSGGAYAPMELCIICGDFKTDERPCPECGNPAKPWPAQE